MVMLKSLDEILFWVQNGIQYARLNGDKKEIEKYFEKIESLVKSEINRPKRNGEIFKTFFEAADAWCKECLKSANPKPFEEWIFDIEKGRTMNSKNREKLQRISEAITVNTLPNGVQLVSNTLSLEEIKQTIDEVLAEPIRNCDKFSKAEVLEELKHRSFSKEDTIEWLYE